MNAKKFGIGFVIALFAVLAVSVDTFASVRQEDFSSVVQSTSSLYDNGFVNDVLTSRNPIPWNVVKHYVGNRHALIVRILKEQKISLDPSVKYPVGMAVTVPQKYILKELLPSPSQAEVALKEAEHQAELKNQADEFFVSLKAKETALATSYGFLVFLAIALFAAIMTARSWYNKFVGAKATVDAKERELDRTKEDYRKLKSLASSLEMEISKLRDELVKQNVKIVKLLAQTPGQYLILKDNSGKEHKCLINWTGWDEKNKVNDVWLQCPYCDLDAKNMLGHISGNHPEQMSPDPKSKLKPITLTIKTEAL